MLDVLPPDIVLIILSYLPIRQLQYLTQLSTDWKQFIETHESNVYHATAILHGFVPPNTVLEEAANGQTWLIECCPGIYSWKDLCREYYHMESKWEGYEQPTSSNVSGPGRAVWRFKIDPEQRTIITTHFDGGLNVTGIKEDEVLWKLRSSDVHGYAHCEFTNGYLIVTRRGDAVDVWRRKCDAEADPPPSPLYNDFIQQRASCMAWQSPSSSSNNDRGAFVPWTVIEPPDSVRALRAADSILLLASLNSQELYLYDLKTGALKQTLSFRKRPTDPPTDLNYIELGQRHAFVCTLQDVHVIPLDPDNSATALSFPSQIQGFHTHCDSSAIRLSYNEDNTQPIYIQTAAEKNIVIECICEEAPQWSIESPMRNFTAVHVSPCGKHFATTDERGFLFIVRDFEDALRNGKSLLDKIIMIDMRHPITNLAFEEDGRIAVYVEHQGLFLLPMVTPDIPSINTQTMEPVGKLRIFHVRREGTPEAVQFCSCLQMTRSEIWYSLTRLDVQPDLGLANNVLRRIDFSEESSNPPRSPLREEGSGP